MDRSINAPIDSDVVAFQQYVFSAGYSAHKYLKVENCRFKILDSNEEASTFEDVFKHAETLLAQKKLTLEHRTIIVQGMEILFNNFQSRGSWITTFLKDINRPFAKESQIDWANKHLGKAKQNLQAQEQKEKTLEKIASLRERRGQISSKYYKEFNCICAICKNKTFMNNISDLSPRKTTTSSMDLTFVLQKKEDLKKLTSEEVIKAIKNEVKNNFGSFAQFIKVNTSQKSDFVVVEFSFYFFENKSRPEMKEKIMNTIKNELEKGGEIIQRELSRTIGLGCSIQDGNLVVIVSTENPEYHELLEHSSHHDLQNGKATITLSSEDAKKYILSTYEKTSDKLLFQ